jgi:hypothetical protein
MDAVVTDNVHLIGCLHISKSVSPDAWADIQRQTCANSHLICAEVKSSLVQDFILQFNKVGFTIACSSCCKMVTVKLRAFQT